eukprot:m.70183 g.70183  ORF g.70183 m.70183 type:complete len:56 (+) comp50112_c3_seq1:597-764(+)
MGVERVCWVFLYESCIHLSMSVYLIDVNVRVWMCAQAAPGSDTSRLPLPLPVGMN